jgi:hypothetical protein
METVGKTIPDIGVINVTYPPTVTKPKPMKVLVCGGRDFKDHKWLFAELDAIHTKTPITLLVNGGAWGADDLASKWAISHRVPYEVHLANWNKFGKAAGPIRNAEMLRKAVPDLVVAFPGGVGTADMIVRAIAAKVEVRRPVAPSTDAP